MSCCNTATYKRLRRVLCRTCNLYRPRRKTAHRALQALFRRLCQLNHPLYQTNTTSHCTTCDTLERLPAPELCTDTRYHRHAGTLHRSAYPPYYNKVYKGAGVRSCYGPMPDSAAYNRPCQPGRVCSYRLRSLASATPGAPAEGSASPPVQGQPGGL